MKYVIKYTYDWFHLGCDCCTDWDSEMHVYELHTDDDGITTYTTHHTSLNILSMYDENDLREYIELMHPEFSNYTLHPDSYFA